MAPSRFGCPITSRQLEVMRLVADGVPPKDIAARLNISLHTVVSHLKNVFAALDVHSAAHAVSRLGRAGWLGWDMPSADERPFLVAYLQAFDRSGWPGPVDQRSRLIMDLALLGDRLGGRHAE